MKNGKKTFKKKSTKKMLKGIAQIGIRKSDFVANFFLNLFDI